VIKFLFDVDKAYGSDLDHSDQDKCALLRYTACAGNLESMKQVIEQYGSHSLDSKYSSDLLSQAIDHVESATDYQYTRLGDAKQYLLPVHSETLSCHRGSDVCERNTIDFRNYHKYSGESTVTFGPAKEN